MHFLWYSFTRVEFTLMFLKVMFNGIESLKSFFFITNLKRFFKVQPRKLYVIYNPTLQFLNTLNQNAIFAFMCFLNCNFCATNLLYLCNAQYFHLGTYNFLICHSIVLWLCFYVHSIPKFMF